MVVVWEEDAPRRDQGWVGEKAARVEDSLAG